MKKNLTILASLTLFSAFVFAEHKKDDFKSRRSSFDKVVASAQTKALQEAVEIAANDNKDGLFGETSKDYVVCYHKEGKTFKSTVHPAKERVGKLVTEQTYDTDEEKNAHLKAEVVSVLEKKVYKASNHSVIHYKIGASKKSALVMYLANGKTDRCLLVAEKTEN